MEESIYDQIGGFVKVRKIILEFYNRVLEDEILAQIFKNSDMELIIDHQTQFLAMLLGGPVSFKDNELNKFHDGHEIGSEHFELMKDYLIETLEDFDLGSEHIDHISNEFELIRDLIITI